VKLAADGGKLGRPLEFGFLFAPDPDVVIKVHIGDSHGIEVAESRKDVCHETIMEHLAGIGIEVLILCPASGELGKGDAGALPFRQALPESQVLVKGLGRLPALGPAAVKVGTMAEKR